VLVSTGVIDLGEVVLSAPPDLVSTGNARARRAARRSAPVDSDAGRSYEPFDRLEPFGDPDADDTRPVPLPRSWAILLSVVGLAMLTAGIRIPPPPQEIDRVPLGLGHYQMIGRQVYLLSGVGSLTGVSALDAVDGRRLWQADLRERIDYADVNVAGGVAVISPDPCTSGTVGSLVAIDTGTGAERWRSSGVPVRLPPGTPVTVVVRASWSDRCGAIIGINRPLGGDLQWEGRDPATGAVRWQYTVPAGSRVALSGDRLGSRWAAVVDPDGRASFVDLLSGAVSAPVPDLAVRTNDRIAGVGDLFLVSRLPGASPSRDVMVMAYDRRTLSPVWTARVGVPERPVANAFDYYAAVPCGGSVCVVAEGTTALAPDTGAVRWQSPRTMYTDTPAGLLADYTWGFSVGGTTGVFVHDPRTGQRVARLGTWRLLGVDDAGGRLLIGRSDGDKTVLGWLRDQGGPEAIGALPAHFEHCDVFGDRLACESSIDELWLLRVRR
jgi:hypothetical protein